MDIWFSWLMLNSCRRFTDALPMAGAKITAIEALAQTTLEHTTWYNGYLADYYVCSPLKVYMNITLLLSISPMAWQPSRDPVRFLSHSRTAWI